MNTRATQSMYCKGKKNCSDYKQAVDLDKRSGGGKIIMTFAFMIYVRTYGQDLQLLQVYPRDLIHH